MPYILRSTDNRGAAVGYVVSLDPTRSNSTSRKRAIEFATRADAEEFNKARLKANPSWAESHEAVLVGSDLPEDAAAEIERLSLAVEDLQGQNDRLRRREQGLKGDVDYLYRRLNVLKAEVNTARSVTTDLLQAEVDDLRGKLMNSQARNGMLLLQRDAEMVARANLQERNDNQSNMLLGAFKALDTLKAALGEGS